MRCRQLGQPRRRRLHRRTPPPARRAPPRVMAAGALAAVALIAFGLTGCASNDVSVGGVRIEPGAETVYVLGRGDANRACHDAAVMAAALGTATSTARVARCSVVGASIVCNEEEITCLGAEKAQR